MKFKLLILSLNCLASLTNFSQVPVASVKVDRQLQDTFSFTKKWDYDWDILKDDNGKFYAADGRKIKDRDTVHLYFTANCSTNVQGGYLIRYCYADQTGDTMRLVFSDGLPAYASSFNLYIVRDTFYFKPVTIYPVNMNRQKFVYETSKQQLTLNKNNYRNGDRVMGTIDIEFMEKFTAPTAESSTRAYYLRGCFSTPLK
jgi:hypothetical protein